MPQPTLQHTPQRQQQQPQPQYHQIETTEHQTEPLPAPLELLEAAPETPGIATTTTTTIIGTYKIHATKAQILNPAHSDP